MDNEPLQARQSCFPSINLPGCNSFIKQENFLPPSSLEQSSSLRFCCMLKEQQMPWSVIVGVNNLLQLTGLPIQWQVWRRCPGEMEGSLVMQGSCVCWRSRNRAGNAFSSRVRSNMDLVRFLMKVATELRSSARLGFTRKSIAGGPLPGGCCIYL